MMGFVWLVCGGTRKGQHERLGKTEFIGAEWKRAWGQQGATEGGQVDVELNPKLVTNCFDIRVTCCETLHRK